MSNILVSYTLMCSNIKDNVEKLLIKVIAIIVIRKYCVSVEFIDDVTNLAIFFLFLFVLKQDYHQATRCQMRQCMKGQEKYVLFYKKFWRGT